ncbi:MAG: secE [Chlamydiales bacterium]|jgi:preprotein translocase subunit SecE|nr:secE [Chlamydiales bacterium]
MDAKKNPLTSSPKQAETTLFDAASHVKQEFHKISWTSAEELRLYTKVVVLATFFFGMAIYAADLVVQTFLSGIGIFFRLISG